MVGDAKGDRFEPANITAKAGDGIKFIVESMGPHNVAFDVAKVPADSKAQLDANFGTDRMGELSSGLKMNPGDAFTLSLGGLKAGKYEFNCTPHLAMNMKGTLTITP
jgi:plastocyanin